MGYLLSHATGNQQVDAILLAAIDLLEKTLPGRSSAYYLHGSFVEQTGIATSDIDLFLIAKSPFTPEEHKIVQRVTQQPAFLAPFPLEIIVLDEARVLQEGHYRLTAASALLWGRDIRDTLPEQTLDQYLRMYAHFPLIYLAHMLRNVEHAPLTLTYPRPDEEFYGYDQQQLPPGNEPRHNIKKLVTSVCWTATVLTAWYAGKMVTGKYASTRMYREYVGDEWSSFIEDMYRLGNRRWHYLVPEDQDERRKLRQLCAQTLAFEQHYLNHYKDYLLHELQCAGERGRLAEQRLAQIDIS